MKQKKEKKRKLLISRVFDLLIIPVYIAISALFLYEVNNYTSKYLIPLAAILVLILAIGIVTTFYHKTVIDILRRLFLIVLCGCMVFGFLELRNVNSFLGDISGDKDNYKTVHMDLYSLASNDYFTATVNDYSEIDGAKVAYQSISDEEAGAYVVEQIKEEYPNIEDYVYKSYDAMIQDLQNGYIDVAIINEDQIDSLESTYGSLSDFTIKLKTIDYKQKLDSDANNVDVTKDTFTVLISGTDELGSPSDASKSDVNMLVMINPNTSQIVMVSIPRDSYLPNPALSYGNDKLTHTGNNGAKNTAEAISYAFDINVDFYVKVSFTSLIDIVDCLGGVDVDVPIYIEEQDENRSKAAEDLIVLYPGEQTLNGKQALAFARHRHGYTDGDLGRNRAQVQIIKGIIKKLESADGIAKIDDLLDIAEDYVLTNFTDKQIQSFVKNEIDEQHDWQISTMSLSNVSTGADYCASYPYQALSVVYLDKEEVSDIHAVYDMMSEGVTLNQFSFDLDDLYGNSDYEDPDGVYLLE